MVSVTTLKRTVEEGLRYLARQKDVREAEVFAAENVTLSARLNYTSHIPCNGVEEPKSLASSGLSVRAIFLHPQGPRLGMGSEPGDLSLNGIKAALEKARRTAVPDPHVTTLPGPPTERRTLSKYHDPRTMDLLDKDLVRAGWATLTQALQAFEEGAWGEDRFKELGLIVGGDVTILQERMAVGSSRLGRVQSDESTVISSFVTAMVEREDAKGSSYGCTTHWKKFQSAAGAEAARHAAAGVGGVRIKDGDYRVILGPQAVTDLLHQLVLPSLSADAFYERTSAFHGQVGRQIAHPRLSLYDHGALPGHAASRGVTCEGLPTGRTDLIKDGVLVGLLSSFYETERLLRDPEAKDKLGVSPELSPQALVPRNGFRRAAGSGRRFDMPPSVSPTNVFIKSKEEHSFEDLLRQVENGVYIGGIWYTYPINGLRAGDFTCTVVGDSYLIKDGKRSVPLKANTVRINDNIHHVLKNIMGVTRKSRATAVWAANEIVYAPEIALSRLKLTDIAGYMDQL